MVCERRHRIKNKYGVSELFIEEIIIRQGWVCKICGNPCDRTKRKQTENIDHCHRTGIVRGILCLRCNQMIGLSGDNPDILNRAVQYLEDSYLIQLPDKIKGNINNNDIGIQKRIRRFLQVKNKNDNMRRRIARAAIIRYHQNHDFVLCGDVGTFGITLLESAVLTLASHGFSRKDICKLLKRKESAIKSLLRRARKKIKK